MSALRKDLNITNVRTRTPANAGSKKWLTSAQKSKNRTDFAVSVMLPGTGSNGVKPTYKFLGYAPTKPKAEKLGERAWNKLSENIGKYIHHN